MEKRAKPVQRSKQPLAPANGVILVVGEEVLILDVASVTPDKVGLKAYGLASIPSEWTKPYFIISGSEPYSTVAIEEAFSLANINPHSRVLVRSSGIDETLDRRGTLISAPCHPSHIAAKIAQLSSDESLTRHSGVIHWVIQELVQTQAKGHLSNERRLNRDLRDWVVEVEPSASNQAETHRIAIRNWRDATMPESRSLLCTYRENYINRLEDVARWTYARKIRVHFEWVWDGATLYVVQADPCEHVSHGVMPETLVKVPTGTVNVGDLRVFRLANQTDFTKYRKLGNAGIYHELGYEMPSFYILDCQSTIEEILKGGEFTADVIADLEYLTMRPLVIRTDGLDIPEVNRQMLPRSDELRSSDSAKQWLIERFRAFVVDGDLESCQLCLLAHHFIPAVASAWCQADPSARRVRIESLWGIPEGLYWYAHDVFDVDTVISSITAETPQPDNMRIRERTRFKGRFVAPDEGGAWVVHHTSENADWKRSIHRREWIEEIAWSTRKISQTAGKPVVVMWLIDIPSGVSKHRVLPWYHEGWKQTTPVLRAAPRGKLSATSEFELHTRDDWEALKRRLANGECFSRIIVDPREPEMVRDPRFATELAEVAKAQKFVVELSGGILSHAYYMLSSSGCSVECADLDDYALEDSEVAFNKLVRDKIPESIAARGEDVVVYRLEQEALIVGLRRKLVEEAFEVMDASTAIQITEELADLREVMLALASRLNITEASIEAARERKKRGRGAFEQGLMLSKTTLASPFSSTDVDMLAQEAPYPERTLSLPSEMPASSSEIHSDKRFDARGQMEKQFTVTLPSHGEGLRDLKTVFSLDTPDGASHEMLLELKMERNAAELRCRLRLLNTPKQLELSFFAKD